MLTQVRPLARSLPESLSLVLISGLAIACPRTRDAKPPEEDAAHDCIASCHEDQHENPEETPYDCRAACEDGEMRGLGASET